LREYTTPAASPTDSNGSVICASSAMREVLVLAGRVAAGDAKVLITGESGVGKDLVARYIHAYSPRARRSFIAVNCGALTETLLESELFGHTRGSFTGAHRDKVGKLQLADRGTIFLDEVGDMSVRMQVLLLRFLENGEIQPVGADAPVTRVDARVIAATNRNLPELVASSAFREDVLYRIQVGHIHVPALRHRVEDIRPLVEQTVARTGRIIDFSDDVWAMLEAYRWPGNVRELQNVIERVIWMSGAERIEAHHLPPAVRTAQQQPVPIQERRRQLADDLYTRIVSGNLSFWGQLHAMFLSRDITRHDLRELLRRGLAATYGNYHALVTHFGMEPGDYKRFLNFLAAHDCNVDARRYRRGASNAGTVGAPMPADPITLRTRAFQGGRS
jgi:transcriptional regulator with PAS, ATPase and Fis domain